MPEHLIYYSEGQGYQLAKVTNLCESWDQFAERFREPVRTKETFVQYSQLDVDAKTDKKRASGYFMAACCKDGHRNRDNIQPRNLLTIDIDENAKPILESLQNGTNWISSVNYLFHTTRSHSPANPKIRIIIPTTTTFDKEQHASISRIVSSYIDPTMTSIDGVSHRAAQMMFYPSVSCDSEYLFHKNETDVILDPEYVLQTFRDSGRDPTDFAQLPVNPIRENQARDTSGRAQDPLEKKGIIGEFCRTYSITEAMAELLSDHYIPSDQYTDSEPRYTPVNSAGSNGVVVYNDDTMVYSNHSTDPIAGMNVNAFDLVRICKYGRLDDKVKEGDSPSSYPSYKEMRDFAKLDGKVQDTQRSEMLDHSAMFADSMVEDAPTTSADGTQLPPQTEYNEEWSKHLELDIKNGGLKNSHANITRIIHHDPRLRGAIAHNELSGCPVAIQSIQTAMSNVPQIIVKDTDSGDLWTDKHNATIRAIIAERHGTGYSGYGVDPTDRTLRDAVIIEALNNSFHPIIDILNANPWDEIPRLDTALHRYMGTPNDTYHAEIFTLLAIAAVGRVREPGLKFDNLIVLEGKQGQRKSAFVRAMGLDKYYTEIKCDVADPQKVAETLNGSFVVELDEMTQNKKSDAEEMKSFLSRRSEKVRMAYARTTDVHPRQCVFVGTTNEKTYLKDMTGNRRFWPVEVKVDTIDIESFEHEWLQMLGEADYRYKQLRQQDPKGDLWLDIRSPETKAIHDKKTREALVDSSEVSVAGQIEELINTPMRLGDFRSEQDVTSYYEQSADDDLLVIPRKYCLKLVHRKITNLNQATIHFSDNNMFRKALAIVPNLERTGDRKRFPGMGPQTVYEVMEPPLGYEDTGNEDYFVKRPEDYSTLFV